MPGAGCEKGSLETSRRIAKAMVAEKNHEKVVVINTPCSSQTVITTGQHGSSEEGSLPSLEIVGLHEQKMQMNEGDVFCIMRC